MTEENTSVPQDTSTASVTTPTEDTPNEESAPSDTEWKDMVGGKYSTPKELAKAHKELEKKLGELGDKVKQGEDFAQAVQPILELARQDPEVFKVLDEKLRKIESKPASEQSDHEVKEVKTVASDLILARFEEKHGIDKLGDSEQKQLRANIGTIISELTGQNLNNVDLRRLPMILDRAYTLATAKSKPESSDDGMLPPISSSPGKQEKTLSQEEASVAAKMGLTREQYLEGKKS